MFKRTVLAICLSFCLFFFRISLHAEGTISPLLKVDNFGWRTGDVKSGVCNQNPGPAAEIRNNSNNTVVLSLKSSNISHFGIDKDSGDDAWIIDFTSLTTPGKYYLYVPSLKARSYDFEIKDDIYNIVGTVGMRTYYYQRCNTPKKAPYAGVWTDAACHMTEFACPPFKGAPDLGKLDLHGGWHDAGDYQKSLWSCGVEQLLWAYEVNGSKWTDGQLNIPESGNGIPDILDEIQWELDFFCRMQRPDGHFLSSVKGCGGDAQSPPSANNANMGYFDTKSYGCSGGGVTIEGATGYAVLTLAHAAIVFEKAGCHGLATKYGRAARKGWNWLRKRRFADDVDNTWKTCAAAAMFRLNPKLKDAGKFVETANLTNIGPANHYYMVFAFWEYLANPAGNQRLKEGMKKVIVERIIDTIFSVEAAYTALIGKVGDPRDWHWGSNQNQASYGADLMMAIHFGILGDHSERQIENLAEKFIHFLLGRNNLNMVYLSDMAAYGGEHSSFQFYHSWFSYTGNDGDHGNVLYNGKPESVVEPMYPYYKDDNQVSKYGPTPGFLVGGPNPTYRGIYTPPKGEKYPAKAYRDFSVGCQRKDKRCEGASWQITENDVGFQGPFILLLSFFMQ